MEEKNKEMAVMKIGRIPIIGIKSDIDSAKTIFFDIISQEMNRYILKLYQLAVSENTILCIDHYMRILQVEYIHYDDCCINYQNLSEEVNKCLNRFYKFAERKLNAKV